MLSGVVNSSPTLSIVNNAEKTREIMTHSVLAVATIFCVIGVVKVSPGPGHEVLCPLRTRLAERRAEDRKLLHLTPDHQATAILLIVRS